MTELAAIFNSQIDISMILMHKYQQTYICILLLVFEMFKSNDITSTVE